MDINGYTSRGPLHSMVPSACCGAMASIALPRVSTEDDRQIKTGSSPRWAPLLRFLHYANITRTESSGRSVPESSTGDGA